MTVQIPVRDRDFLSEEERAYWSTPEATPERQAAWQRWLDDYTINLALRWIDEGQCDHEEALRGAAAVQNDWSRLDEIEWMPLGEALSVQASGVVAHKLRGGGQAEGDSRVEFMNAMRTAKTSTHTERLYAVAYQLGVTFEYAKQHFNFEEQMYEPDLRARRTAVYRCFDAAGLLLYVGIAHDPAARETQHARASKWHAFQADRTVEWFDDRNSAEEAERTAIRDEAPLFNNAHSTAGARSRAMDYLFDRAAATARRSA